MADEMRKGYPNIFIANTIYPEASSIFSFQLEPIEKIKDDCYFVLDTNVLIALYINEGKANLLDECQKIYSSLVAEKRLIIPGQVAREFAKVRQDKLVELHQQLIRKKNVKPIERDRYPLLSSLDELKEAGQLADEINRKIKEYQQSIDKIVASIREWNWNDPVSMLYHNIFTEETILDILIKEDEVKKDLHTRKEHDIPPGFKDSSKKDEGIGDLLIWLTILEVGRLYNKSVIFVSGDEKADWYKISENYALYPRYELVDEFRRASGGCSFHMIRFSRFLDLFGVTNEIVKQVERNEGKTVQPLASNYAILKWEEDVTAILKKIQTRFRMHLLLEDADMDSIKLETAFYIEQLLHLKEFELAETPKFTSSFLELCINILYQIYHRKIYIDGGKSLNELHLLMRDLISTIDDIFRDQNA